MGDKGVAYVGFRQSQREKPGGQLHLMKLTQLTGFKVIPHRLERNTLKFLPST